METRNDWDRIESNVKAMKAKNASDNEIHRYVNGEGVQGKFSAWHKSLSSRMSAGHPSEAEMQQMKQTYGLQ